MALLPLAPAADRSIQCTIPARCCVPTGSDWATLYPEIQKLYVCERRKLRYIMRYVEVTYGFKATEQMYKKRFTKWGFQKNSRRLAVSPQTSTAIASESRSPSGHLSSVPSPLESNPDDGLLCELLTSVQTWSMSFYESVQSKHQALASAQHSWPEQSYEMNLTFKLVIDTLDRGHGSLAGRLARKAFLRLEEMLMLEGPALIWNMLEIMHYMVATQHLQLFQLLLAHLTALADRWMPKHHPLPVILRSLRVFIASVAESSKSASTLPCSPPSNDRKEARTPANGWRFSSAILPLIERAWTLNAEILFDHFDQRLFQLYLRIHWDSCSIVPPVAIIGAVKQWLSQITPHQVCSDTTNTEQTDKFIQITPFEKDKMLQHVLATPVNALPPHNYEYLRLSSHATLRHHASSILCNSSSSVGDAATLLRILASLVTTRVLERWPATIDHPRSEVNATSKISRGHARNVALAVKTSMVLNADYNELEASPWDTVRLLRSTLALLEYANAETDPRIVREMWLLEDAFVAAGEPRKALEIKQVAFQRLEEFIQEIPIHST